MANRIHVKDLAPFASSEDLSDRESPLEDGKRQLPKISEENVRVSANSALVTPRIEFSRASSSSYQEDSEAEELAARKNTIRAIIFEEKMTELHSSAEDIADNDVKRKRKLHSQQAITDLEVDPRKDSTCSDVGLLSISGRTSRVSSVGSVISAGSGASVISGTSHLSVTSNYSRASRTSSPHRMSLETSFCGPKAAHNMSLDVEEVIKPLIDNPHSPVTRTKPMIESPNSIHIIGKSPARAGAQAATLRPSRDNGPDNRQRERSSSRPRPVIGNPKTQKFVSLYSDEEDDTTRVPANTDKSEKQPQPPQLSKQTPAVSRKSIEHKGAGRKSPKKSPRTEEKKPAKVTSKLPQQQISGKHKSGGGKAIPEGATQIFISLHDDEAKVILPSSGAQPHASNIPEKTDFTSGASGIDGKTQIFISLHEDGDSKPVASSARMRNGGVEKNEAAKGNTSLRAQVSPNKSPSRPVIEEKTQKFISLHGSDEEDEAQSAGYREGERRKKCELASTCEPNPYSPKRMKPFTNATLLNFITKYEDVQNYRRRSRTADTAELRRCKEEYYNRRLIPLKGDALEGGDARVKRSESCQRQNLHIHTLEGNSNHSTHGQVSTAVPRTARSMSHLQTTPVITPDQSRTPSPADKSNFKRRCSESANEIQHFGKPKSRSNSIKSLFNTFFKRTSSVKSRKSRSRADMDKCGESKPASPLPVKRNQSKEPTQIIIPLHSPDEETTTPSQIRCSANDSAEGVDVIDSDAKSKACIKENTPRKSRARMDDIPKINVAFVPHKPSPEEIKKEAESEVIVMKEQEIQVVRECNVEKMHLREQNIIVHRTDSDPLDSTDGNAATGDELIERFPRENKEEREMPKEKGKGKELEEELLTDSEIGSALLPGYDEEKDLISHSESLDDDLPYVPTTLPLERSVAVPIVPVKERVSQATRSIDRPRSSTSLNLASLDTYVVSTAANISTAKKFQNTAAPSDAPAAIGEKLRITLPRVDGAPSEEPELPPKLGKPRESVPVIASDRANDDTPPPLPPRKSSLNKWISFDETGAEVRQSPKRITAIPNDNYAKECPPLPLKEKVNFVKPEDCSCECHDVVFAGRNVSPDDRDNETRPGKK